jgi:hypothetical protein
VSAKPMPVISFGAEFEVAHGLGIGPQMRWYIVSVDSACLTDTRQEPSFDPNTGLPGPSTQVTSTDCANNISTLTVPDILFVGVGLTYRIGI